MDNHREYSFVIEIWKLLPEKSRSCKLRSFEGLGFVEEAVQNFFFFLAINTIPFLLDLNFH